MSGIKLPCEIVEDILPSYVDGLTSTVTNDAVEAHVEQCERCRSMLSAMKAPEPERNEAQEIEVNYLKKTKKRTIGWIVFGVIMTALLTFAYLVYVAFNGSIIQKARYTKLVRAYVEEKYAGENFTVDRAVYDFKMNSYYCKVSDPNSEDRHFVVYPENGQGALMDDYDNSVTGMWNTTVRLSRALDDATDELFSDLPWRQRLLMTDFAEGSPDVTRMYLDMPFDLQALPGEIELTVWIESDGDEPTWEEIEQKIVELKAYVESKGVYVDYYSLSLEYPYTEDENHELWPVEFGSEVILWDVPASVIDDPDALHEYAMNYRAQVEWDYEHMEKEPAIDEITPNEAVED